MAGTLNEYRGVVTDKIELQLRLFTVFLRGEVSDLAQNNPGKALDLETLGKSEVSHKVENQEN